MRTATFAGAAVLTLSMAGTAQAVVIDDTDLAACSGLDPCSVAPGVSITADPNGLVLEVKNFNGAQGLGISGQTGGEIDIGEIMTFSFTNPEIINSIKLLFIYNGPEFGDPKEIASISFANSTGVFQVFDENSGSWSLNNGAVITNCSATAADSTGCFTISNPFAQAAGQSLVFTAVFSTGGTNNNSDFSIGGLSTVPEPATIALLGTGLIGLGAMLRRRRDA